MLAHIIARLKEPSSYAAIAAALAVFGVVLPESLAPLVTQAGVGIAALLAFFLPESPPSA